MSIRLTEDEIVAKQRGIFDRERELEAEQKALDAVIEAHGYDAEALMYRAYEAPEAP